LSSQAKFSTTNETFPQSKLSQLNTPKVADSVFENEKRKTPNTEYKSKMNSLFDDSKIVPRTMLNRDDFQEDSSLIREQEKIIFQQKKIILNLSNQVNTTRRDAVESVMTIGCQQLVDAICDTFNIIEKKNVSEMVNSPEDFGSYLSFLRNDLASEIAYRDNQIRNLEREVQHYKESLNAKDVSDNTKRFLKNVVSKIEKNPNSNG
jgi:hypothetical protein